MQLCALYVEMYKQKMYKPKLHIFAFFFCFAILYDKGGGGGSYIKMTICDPGTRQLDKGKSAPHSAGTNCPYNRPIVVQPLEKKAVQPLENNLINTNDWQS